MKIYVSTKNKHKLEEIEQILGGIGYEVLSAYTIVDDSVDVEETGATFEDNAILKAVALSKLIDGLVIADDSGLTVDALGGAPGVYSARYAGVDATDEDNYRKLLDEMKGKTERSARFMCVIALAEDGNIVSTFSGSCEGAIGEEPSGENGFGYDPVFVLSDGRSMAELAIDEKNSISHRHNALIKLRGFLEKS